MFSVHSVFFLLEAFTGISGCSGYITSLPQDSKNCTDRYISQFENNFFAEMSRDYEEGSY